MIDAYVWTTPNGYKLLIGLEELALPYEVHWVDITKGEQMKPEFLAINPNNKIPAIVDRETKTTVFESGAVLWYLANKAAKLLPSDERGKYAVLEWLFWSTGGPGPMIGQAGYWTQFAKEKNPAAIERYTTETERLLRVANVRLGESAYLAGGEYTVADVMSFPWLRAPGVRFGFDMAPYPHLARWLAEIEKRPAVARALAMKPA